MTISTTIPLYLHMHQSQCTPREANNDLLKATETFSIKHARPGRIPHGRRWQTANKRPPAAELHRRRARHPTTSPRSDRELRQPISDNNNATRRDPTPSGETNRSKPRPRNHAITRPPTPIHNINHHIPQVPPLPARSSNSTLLAADA